MSKPVDAEVHSKDGIRRTIEARSHVVICYDYDTGRASHHVCARVYGKVAQVPPFDVVQEAIQALGLRESHRTDETWSSTPSFVDELLLTDDRQAETQRAVVIVEITTQPKR